MTVNNKKKSNNGPTLEYEQFLDNKKTDVIISGFEIEQELLNPNLYPFQKYSTQIALRNGRFALFSECGTGKGQPYGSKILTPSGWTNIEDLASGGYIYASTGKKQKITGIYPKQEIDTYRFHYSDRTSCVFDEEHLHICRTYNDRTREKDWRVLSTKDLISLSNIRYGKEGQSRTYDIPVVKPIEFSKKHTVIHPYLMGVLLGDGHLKGNIGISNPDKPIIKRVREVLPNGIKLKQKSKYDYHIKTGLTGNKRHPFRQEISDIGLLNKLSYQKHIPEKYLFGCIDDRLELLRGLMDTDGYIAKSGSSEYYTTSIQLKEDIVFLIRSLGGVPTTRIKRSPKYVYNNETRTGRDCHIITFSLKTYNPFFLKRKADKWNSNPRDNGRWIDRIEFEKKQKTICLSVDSPDKSYITENFVVTHNTIMQLEWANQVSLYTNQPILILAPLAVVNQTIEEGNKFGIPVDKLKPSTKSNNISNGIWITNYEQIKNIDVSLFSGIVLDESSILKGRDGKLSTLLIDSFSHCKYRLCCTATPSPNDHMELGQHSEFLGQMSYLEMLAMYFVHDGGETSKWRLRKHAQDDFWKYVCSWSIAIDHPSTLGFEMDGYDLPEIEYIEHIIPVENNSDSLFGDMAVSATDINRDLRRSLKARVEKACELVNSNDEQWIVWGLQNAETDLLAKKIKGAVNVQGKDTPEYKAEKLLGFAHNDFRVLVTKTSIAKFGMNFQNAHNMLFASYDFKFEAFYQAVRREYRFFQLHKVYVHLLVPESQLNVRKSILKKEKDHIEMIRQMSLYSANTNYKMNKTMEIKEKKIIESEYSIYNGDCVTVTKQIQDNKADLVLFSPPFAELYVYSDKAQDMGNVKNYQQFEDHFRYLVPELKRVLKPGRICAIHCMDLPIQKGKEGFIGLRDFSGMLIDMFTEQGFIYHARTTLWKNPVTEMQRTKALGLLHKQIKKDSVMSRVGIPDYILFFRNEGENKTPIIHQDTDPSKPDYLPVDLWQKYASPVWMDIDYSRTLQYRSGRDGNDEKHICPLQLDTIDRILHLYSNEGETVFDPFGGIGSTGYQSIKMNRKSISIELKESYFKVNARNHKDACVKNLELFP